MKKLILLIAFVLPYCIAFAQAAATEPTKEIEIKGTLKASATESTNDPSTNRTEHKFTCLVNPNEVCLKINKPGLATGETVDDEQLPAGSVDVGELITIALPAIPNSPLYFGYFIDYSTYINPLNSGERTHSFTLLNE